MTDRDAVQKAYLAFKAGAGLSTDDVIRLFGVAGIALSTYRARALGKEQLISAAELMALISTWAAGKQTPGQRRPYRCPYPDCRAVSYHPMDAKNGYCGRCHRWAEDQWR